MHVEFRIGEISNVSAFDVESFFRVKELCAKTYDSKVSDIASTVAPAPAAAAANSSLLTLTNAKKKKAAMFTPEVQLQISFDKVVSVESSVLQLRRERKQHEKLLKTNWDGSEIQTQRYCVTPSEVLLGSFPMALSESVIKVRLLQLSPSVDRFTDMEIDRALSSVPEAERRSPICIGVAKITLKELVTVRGGVCIALQAKQNIVRAVEERNLNTVATNGIFGKDVGGSALLTFQVIAFAFGTVAPSRLLMCKNTETRESTPSLSDQNSASPQDAFSPPPKVPNSVSGGGLSHRSLQEGIVVGNLNSAALRFIIVPYIAVVDGVLRANDILSWRRPLKTAIVLALFFLVLIADILDVALVISALVNVVLSLRRISLLYRGHSLREELTFASPPTSGAQAETYLYGRHNSLINAMVRAHFFFGQGLQEDCFYELVLVIHILRRKQRSIALLCLGVLLITCVLSVSTLIVVGGLLSFVLYPLSLRVPNVRVCFSRNGADNSIWTVVSLLIKSLKLNKPMNITRVVHVCPVSAQSTPAPTPGAEVSPAQEVFRKYLHGRNNSSAGTPLLNTQNSFPSYTTHARAQTFDFDAVALSNYDRRSTATDPSRLSFALISFTFDSGSAPAADGSRNTPYSPFVARFRRYSDDAWDFLGRYQSLSAIGPSTSLASVGKQSSGALEPGANVGAAGTANEALSAFFRDTLSFLRFVEKQSKFQVYVSTSTVKQQQQHDVNQLRLDVFARPSWLIQRGDVDAVTTHLLSTSKNNLTVTKPRTVDGYQNAARAMALLAAVLLQGARLSLYAPNPPCSNCCVIVPLLPSSEKIELLPQPNPCPIALLTTLDEIWRGVSSNNNGAEHAAEDYTVNMVLQVISAYKDAARVGLQSPAPPQDERRGSGLIPQSSRTPRLSRQPRTSLMYGLGSNNMKDGRRENSAPQSSNLQWQTTRRSSTTRYANDLALQTPPPGKSRRSLPTGKPVAERDSTCDPDDAFDATMPPQERQFSKTLS